LEKHDEFIMMTRALIGRLKGRVVLNITWGDTNLRQMEDPDPVNDIEYDLFENLIANGMFCI
jgi:hypothetical protein